MEELEYEETKKTYKSYVNTKKAKKVLKPVTATLFLAAGLFGGFFFAKQIKDTKNYDMELKILERQQREVESQIYKDNEDFELFERLDLINKEIENCKLEKNLTHNNAYCTLGATVASAMFLNFFMQAFEGLEDFKKNKFIETFFNEVTFIRSKMDHELFDSVITFFLKDVQKIENINFEELTDCINKDEVFPTTTITYQNLYKFSSDYLRKTNYKEKNPNLYAALPKTLIDFGAFVSRNYDLMPEEVLQLPKAEKFKIAEAFMKSQMTDEKAKKDSEEPFEIVKA